MAKQLSAFLSSEGLKEAEKWCAKYPEEQRQSAVMQTLMIVQEELGYLTQDRMDAVANFLKMPSIAVYEVATFYSMYEHKPCAKYRLEVCTNISCKLNGAQDVVEHLKETLAINVGETTVDKQFTLREVECLGACVNAPMMQVGQKYHEKLTPALLDEIIADYRKNETDEIS
jgi:NADH-quinone oxidoreductase subunit E